MQLSKYPHISLDKVLRCLPKALEVTSQQPVDRMALVKAFGYAPTTMEASRIVTSMVHFNLLYIANGSGGKKRFQYRPTDLARAIEKARPGDEEWRHLVLKALTNPPLFSDLCTRFGVEPPDNLEVILKEEYGIPEKGVRKAAKVYDRALTLVFRGPPTLSVARGKAEGSVTNRDLGPYSGPITVEFGGGARFTFKAGKQYTYKLTAAYLEAELAAVCEILGGPSQAANQAPSASKPYV